MPSDGRPAVGAPRNGLPGDAPRPHGPHGPPHRDALDRAARARLLAITGGLGPAACAEAVERGHLPAGTRSLLLLSPDGAAFWPGFTASPEWQDGAPDPMDRWSTRVIGAWADMLGATAVFPFGGPPFAPFYSWALASGSFHAAPILLLVHRGMGLMTSFRGALALPWEVAVPPPAPTPCTGCAAPCTTTCPVDALGPDGYDVARCKAHLRRPEGQPCLSGGCLARRACPAGATHGRLAGHSAYHMRQFLGDT